MSADLIPIACKTIVFETIGAAPGTGAATTDPIVDAKLKSKLQEKVFVSIAYIAN